MAWPIKVAQAASRLANNASTKFQSFSSEGQSVFTSFVSTILTYIDGTTSAMEVALGDSETKGADAIGLFTGIVSAAVASSLFSYFLLTAGVAALPAFITSLAVGYFAGEIGSLIGGYVATITGLDQVVEKTLLLDGDDDGYSEGTDTVYLTNSEDTGLAIEQSSLHGDSDNDFLAAVDAASIYGGAGDDEMVAQDLSTAYGGIGNDQILALDGAKSFGGTGNDQLQGQDATLVHGGAGDDELFIAEYAQGWGDEGEDKIIAVGYSTVHGGIGDDDISVGNHATAYGDEDDDKIVGTGNAIIFGGLGNDSLTGTETVSVYGGEGDDSISVDGNATGLGEEGNDSIYAYDNAIAYGGDGNDWLYLLGAETSGDGGTGDDFLLGNGANLFVAGDGNDTVFNLGKNETDGAVQIDGGNGDDSVFALGESEIDLGAGDDSLLLVNGEGSIVLGGQGNDWILALNNNLSQFYGGAGEDLIVSWGGETHLYDNEGAGSDGEEDTFSGTHGTFIQEAGFEDSLYWAMMPVTGGVSQWWMEKGWASWSPITSIFNAVPAAFAFSAGGLAPLVKLAYSIDIMTSLLFQFYGTQSGQLVVQTALGRGGRIVIENYEVDLDTGEGTAGVTVIQQFLTDGGSLSQFMNYVNLALKAGFGTGLDGQDPLILDLDGDGIELSSMAAGELYFDLDGDGFAERAAWTKGGDDGFLARDLNGNGEIDDITELFGTRDTPGLTALSALDSNQDGKITSADTDFDILKVWQDLNSDGVTDVGELSTLTELGITEIDLTGTTPTEANIYGNTIREESTFTRADGSTGIVADALLQTSEIDTVYLGDSTVSTAAAALPALKGYGNLADLRIVMTNDQTLFDLVEDVTELASTTNWQSLKLDTQEILYRWAGVDGVAPTVLATGFDAQMLAFLEIYSGTELVARDGNGDPVVNNADELIATWEDVHDSATIRLGAQGPWATVFTGASYDETSNDFYLDEVDSLSDIYTTAINSLDSNQTVAEAEWADHWGPAIEALTRTLQRVDRISVKSDFEVQNLVRAVQATGTQISLLTFATGLGIEGLQVAAQTGSVLSRDPNNTDNTEIYVSGDGDDQFNGGNWQDVYIFSSNFGNDIINDQDISVTGDRIRFTDLNAEDVTIERVGDDLVISVNGTTDTITVQDQFRLPVGTETTQGQPGFGVEDIQFADGTIYEPGDIAAEIGLGTAGDDTLIGTAREDLLEGLTGNDLLYGGDSGDIYFYTLGDGVDQIHDVRTSVNLTGSDILYLLDGIDKDEITYSRVDDSDDVTLTFSDGGSVKIIGQAGYNALSYGGFDLDNRVEYFFFKSGGTMSWADVQLKLQETYTTAGDDQTYGFATPDELFSSTGNDFLSGLDGGDDYYFDLGSGQDTIHDGQQLIDFGLTELANYDWQADDKLIFGEGIFQEDVSFVRNGSAPDLTISFAGSTDTITIIDQFDADNLDIFGLLGIEWFDRIESIEFSDGSSLSWEDVLALVTQGDDGDNVIYGAYYADTLDGGLGNDYLSGGDDSDTYYFGKGYGQDEIEDNQEIILTESDDTLIFNADVAPSDVVFSRNGNSDDLLVSFTNDTATLTVTGQFDLAYTALGNFWFDRIETFQFQDTAATTIEWDDLFADLIAQDQTSGNDTIYGFDWEDVLDGGLGDDFLSGGNENDTYVFGLGYGHDTIDDDLGNVMSGQFDIVTFNSDLAVTDATLSRDDDDLTISFTSGDQLTLLKQFQYGGLGSGSYDEIEEYHFSDGTIWTAADVRDMLLQGTSGDDVIIGYGFNDTLDGGAGNDRLEGLDGSDTYKFDVGYGHDVIEDRVHIVSYDNDDVVEFGSGVTTSNIEIARNGDDLVFTVQGASDSLTIENIFGDTFGYYEVEEFHFDDGTIWTLDDVKQMILTQSSTSGDDTITGFRGDDLLAGGLGNDTLYGEIGSDTYLFNLGDGQDTVHDEGPAGIDNDIDVIQFGPGIAPEDVIVSSVGADVILSIDGTSDQVILAHQLDTSTALLSRVQIEEVRFDGGQVWTDQDILDILAEGELDPNTTYGTSGDDVISGTSGEDTFEAREGNDTISGNNSGDGYRYRSGDGNDIINELNYHIGTDKLILTDLSAIDITLSRSWTDLEDIIVTDNTTGGTILLDEQLYNSKSGIEEIHYSDSTVQLADSTSLRDLAAFIGTSGADTINGSSYRDVFIGGIGDDTLSGNNGNDSYHYSSGNGNDLIKELNYHTGTDELVLTDLNSTDITLSRSWTDMEDVLLTVNATGDVITLDEQLYNANAGVEEIHYADSSIQAVDPTSLRDLAAFIGTSGNDTINGGSYRDVFEGGLGDDTLSGSNGSDSYVYSSGDGDDIINELNYHTGDDQFVLTDLNASDVTLSVSTSDSNDLWITVNATGDQITIDNQFYNTKAGIEEIIFADGSVLYDENFVV